MVPDIAAPKRQQANSVDSSNTPSPISSSNSGTASLTPSPESRSNFSPSPSPFASSATTSGSSSPSSSVSRSVENNAAVVSINSQSNVFGRQQNHYTIERNGQQQQQQSQQNGHNRVWLQNGYHQQQHKSDSTRFNSTTTFAYKTALPINLVKNQLLARIQQNESIIIIGETGCGKTTQIPKFIYEFYATSKYSQPLKLYGEPNETSITIGITQPRRVAATSIAARVATEVGVQLGELVGYTIRFEDLTTARTRIKYMTDGILLREAISDPLLSKYRVIILDEAHERTVHTDVLFGVVKKAQRLRNSKRFLENNGTTTSSAAAAATAKMTPLKLIIMSATMDVDHFSKYFNNAPVYYIVGRTYPIEIFYTQTKHNDYVQSALATIFQIHQEEDEVIDENNKKDQHNGNEAQHLNNGSVKNGFANNNRSTTNKQQPIGGDIIVFCTGQEEIESMIKIVQDLTPQLNGFKTSSGLAKTLKPYPLYAALPTSKQQEIFTRPPSDCFRRVIFTTNIAETSVTIPNVRFVIDTGKVKSRIYSPATGFEIMQVEDISRAQACQRSGRAGRIAPGKCYRLYTKKEFKKLPAFPIPEIRKCNLANVMLQLMAIGISDVTNFDFVDPPSKEAISASIESLHSMQAIEKVKPSAANPNPAPNEYQLTATGRQMVSFPVDPRYAALIIASKNFRCTEEVIVIISMLSVDSVFFVPNAEREQALKMHKKFHSSEGDLIKLLNVFRRYREMRQSEAWCRENYLRPAQLKMASEIRRQLLELCQRVSIPVTSSAGNTEPVCRCFALGLGPGIGLGANVAILQREGGYRVMNFANNRKSRCVSNQVSGQESNTNEQKDNNNNITLDNTNVHIHPSSCLFSLSTKPECLLFVELVHTTKAYMRNVSRIDSQWLLESNIAYNSSSNIV